MISATFDEACARRRPLLKKPIFIDIKDGTMRRRQFLSGVMKGSAVAVVSGPMTGCGTLFYSERVRQPHSNDIDWKVAALDGLGLLLFFVPGVIAFVVDFSTGAIYLPADHSQSSQAGKDDGLKKIALTRDQIRPHQLERVVSEHVGKPISLDDNEVRLSELDQIEQYEDQVVRHRNDRRFGKTFRTFLDQWKSKIS